MREFTGTVSGNLRKIAASFAASATLAVSAVAIGGVATAPAVGACGWYTEHQNYAPLAGPVRDAYHGGANTYAWFYVTTYNDGCGNRKYTSSISVTTSQTSSTQHHPGLRVWVCGELKWTGHAGGAGQYSQPLSSPPFYYG